MIPVVINTDLPPQIPWGDARLAIIVARRAWPTSKCNGHERVVVSWDVPKWNGVPRVAADRELLGLADLAGQRCMIWIRAGLTRAETCAVGEHEAGHWNGEDDNEPGYPVMRVADDLYIPKECKAA